MVPRQVEGAGLQEDHLVVVEVEQVDLQGVGEEHQVEGEGQEDLLEEGVGAVVRPGGLEEGAGHQACPLMQWVVLLSNPHHLYR